MGWIKRIFGNVDKKAARRGTRIRTPEPAGSGNRESDDDVWDLPEERTEAGDAYFGSLSQMQEAITRQQYKRAARLARENLETIPQWIEEEAYNAAIRAKMERDLDRHFGTDGEVESELADEERSLLPPSIPVFQQGGTILALMSDREGLWRMKDLARSTPELCKWVGHVEKHLSNLELFRSIEEAIHSHPNCLQTDVKRLVGEGDGRRVANLISYLEKGKRIVRVKEGRTYRILPAATKETSSEAQTNPMVSDRTLTAILSDCGVGEESFAAIDFETETDDRDSACALGVVIFERGEPITERRFLIRPPHNEYDPFNTSIHGMALGTRQDLPSSPQSGSKLGSSSVIAWSLPTTLRLTFLSQGEPLNDTTTTSNPSGSPAPTV